MHHIDFPLHQANGYQYLDEGPPTHEHPPVVLLHGMLGDLSNWSATVRALSAHDHHVLTPMLPVYNLPLQETSVPGLVSYVHDFLQQLDVERVVLAGNSLGGHTALLYALRYPDEVAALVLAGASGIYEVNIGSSTPRRQDRGFIRERTELTFYDPVHATDELVDDMYDLINDRPRALRLIKMARSTEDEIVTDQLSQITAPTLLVWGQDDEITPPDVAEEFMERLPNARLRFIERCGHAPMIERPDTFNALTLRFLRRTFGTPAHLSSLP